MRGCSSQVPFLVPPPGRASPWLWADVHYCCKVATAPRGLGLRTHIRNQSQGPKPKGHLMGSFRVTSQARPTPAVVGSGAQRPETRGGMQLDVGGGGGGGEGTVLGVPGRRGAERQDWGAEGSSEGSGPPRWRSGHCAEGGGRSPGAALRAPGPAAPLSRDLLHIRAATFPVLQTLKIPSNHDRSFSDKSQNTITLFPRRKTESLRQTAATHRFNVVLAPTERRLLSVRLLSRGPEHSEPEVLARVLFGC